MSIAIRKVGDVHYTAQLIVPDMPEVLSDWSTPEPMEKDQLIRELLNRGAHQIDIWDAFNIADPDWRIRRKK